MEAFQDEDPSIREAEFPSRDEYEYNTLLEAGEEQEGHKQVHQRSILLMMAIEEEDRVDDRG